MKSLFLLLLPLCLLGCGSPNPEPPTVVNVVVVEPAKDAGLDDADAGDVDANGYGWGPNGACVDDGGPPCPGFGGATPTPITCLTSADCITLRNFCTCDFVAGCEGGVGVCVTIGPQ